MLTGKTCRITGSQRFLNLWVNEQYSHVQNTKWCVSCLKNGEEIRALIVAYGYEDINEIQGHIILKESLKLHNPNI